ncbi:MAG: glucosidase [Antricoccus sp.]
MANEEQVRLDQAVAGTHAWRDFGPYVAERAWGTVREDYSASGDAWSSFPFDHAHARTYRWNEDGLSAWCDARQTVCIGLALWNGQDPILKERYFGLSGPEGNHGEDVKEYWWYSDSTPTHSYVRTVYAYPLNAFPYDDLRRTNAARDRSEPEYELIDTGIFAEDRYAMVTTEWAKASPHDVCIKVTVANRSAEPAEMHLIPTTWFRNNWSWGDPQNRPRLVADGAVIRGFSERTGEFTFESSGSPELLFCENETNVARLYGSESYAGVRATSYPKDGIGDHIINGAPTVNPEMIGTKAAFHHVLHVAAGAEVTLELRFSLDETPGGTEQVQDIVATRRAEADLYWAQRLSELPPENAVVTRKAFAGLLCSKQYYKYDVNRWLKGDRSQPPPPEGRSDGRNSGWRHLAARDVILMPDAWEYPWFAAWDLSFHCVALALIDPQLAKEQLLLLMREWYQHPGGQLPAYEWNFDDINPPVQAWAARQIYLIDGKRDTDFLERVTHKLLINFTTWVNRRDAEGNNIYEGGFLGLDNIGPFDRSKGLPDGAVLEQSDGTAWMAAYCLDMLFICIELSANNPTYEDLATKFIEHFCYIAAAGNEQGLWDQQDAFYYDQIRYADNRTEPVRVRSLVGLLPMIAMTQLPDVELRRLPNLADRMDWLLEQRPDFVDAIQFDSARFRGLLAMCNPQRLTDLLRRMLDSEEFLSPYGIRSLSAYHREHPYNVSVGDEQYCIDYEPAESRTPLFGGNSNWRGPIWLPVNALLISALRRYAEVLGANYQIEYPTGSGMLLRLDAIADNLSARLMGLFLPAEQQQRPCQRGLPWQDEILFNEYFHGDTGFGLGASHQTGWTSMIAAISLGWPR